MNISRSTIQYIIAVSSTGLFIQHACAINRYTILASSASAIIGGVVYGHAILPWYTNKRQQEEIKQKAAAHAQQQIEWRAFYRSVNSKYTAATIPLESALSLSEYKKQLVVDIAKLEQALEFKWNDEIEREAIIKLLQYLKNHELQLKKIIGLKIGKEIQEQYKEEFTLIAKEGNPDTSKLSKIVYEKHGDTNYKFSSYKAALCQAIMTCSQWQEAKETVQALETLNKNINYLFAPILDQERAARENAEKQEKLFNAELDNKHAIKDFYQEAQKHIKQASSTVSHFSEEMEKQCNTQRTILTSCSNMLQSIMNMFTSWGIRSEQQTERIVYEVRQEGRATRDSVKTSVNAVDRKATEAKNQATQAKEMAHAALPPLPPATNPGYQPPAPDDGKPSAPPLP